MKIYHVQPFVPNLSSGQADKAAATVAKQMTQLINEIAAQGWTYEGYEAIPTVIHPGCMGRLFLQGTPWSE